MGWIGVLGEHVIFLFDSFSPPNGCSFPDGPSAKDAAGMDGFIVAKGFYCPQNNVKIM